MSKSTLIVFGIGAYFLTACGAGLPPEVPTEAPVPQGCESSGQPLDFVVNNDAASLFWAEDSRIDPGNPNTDQSKIKLLLDIPQDQLPTGVTTATIRVGVVSNRSLNDAAHVDTVFQIAAVEPADLTGFTGSGQAQLRLTLRYDPVECQIAPEVESTLVLGRLNPDGTWVEVCGDTADTRLAVREVSCSEGNLSFGVFGVIPRVAGTLDDVTPPVFPQGSFSLGLRSRCDQCPTPSIELEWGPASDGGGSGVKGYWIYVNGNRTVFTSDTTATPTVRFTLVSAGGVITTQRNLYQVSAVDNADNESVLFGRLEI